MEANRHWQEFFSTWPKSVPRRGVLVTSYEDQVNFEDFMVSGSMVLLKRRAPDSVGARTVILPFENVVAVKLTDAIENKAFGDMGFSVGQAK